MTLAAKDRVTILNILYSLLGDFGIKITPIIAPGMELNDLTRSINLALNLENEKNLFIFSLPLIIYPSYTCIYLRPLVYIFGAPCVFFWNLKIGQIWGFFKTDDFKIQFLSFEDLKTPLSCDFLSGILKDLKIWRFNALMRYKPMFSFITHGKLTFQYNLSVKGVIPLEN